MTIKQVLVTGATGKTGSIVFQKLQQDPDFQVKGLARSPEKAQKIYLTRRKISILAILRIKRVSKLLLATVRS